MADDGLLVKEKITIGRDTVETNNQLYKVNF